MIVYFLLLTPLLITPLFLKENALGKAMTLPFFALPSSLIKWISFISGILLFLSILFYVRRNGKEHLSCKIKRDSLCILFLQLLGLLLFSQNNHLFLFSVTMILLFCSCLFLYEEIAKQDEKSTFFLNPFVLWSLYLSALSVTTYLLNVR